MGSCRECSRFLGDFYSKYSKIKTETRLLEEMNVKINELINKSCELPPLPVVAAKVMRMVDDPMMDINALQDVIMTDQALTAQILKMANSAYYGMNRNVETVAEALVTLGSGAVRTLALAATTRIMFKRFGLLEQKLWEHSTGVSVAAEVIAKTIRHQSPEKASVAGLLHDIGKIIMNNSQPEKYMLVTENVYNNNTAYYINEEYYFGFNHADVGGLITAKWKFPKDLCEIIRRHHYFRTFSDLADLEPETSSLCCIVTLADAVCARLGIGYREPMADLPLMDRECLKILDISSKQYEELTETIKTKYEEEKASMQ